MGILKNIDYDIKILLDAKYIFLERGIIVMKVIVIGGGPAGIIAAIKAAKEKNDVTIIEKNPSLEKKLLITGKGRCNITSSLAMSEFIKNIPGNGKFLYSAFQNFTNQDIIELLKKQGVAVKEERGNRIFPTSDKSLDVLRALERELKENKIKIKLNCAAEKINTQKSSEDTMVTSVTYIDEHSKYKTELADKIILATGGKSYPLTGSTGDGYKIAEKLGHTIKPVKPSLVPLTARGESLQMCKNMQGLSLKNVGIELEDEEKKKIIYKDFGEMLFTHFGVSGPTILSSSAHLLRYKNIDELIKQNKIKLKIDLKPALSKEKLDQRIQRDFEEEKNKEFKNSLNALLPQKMIDTVIELTQIDREKKVNQITKEERQKLVEVLKNFTITISGFRPIDEAIVTSGGINTKEINPKTMESKLIKGLYFAGEIIDVDAYTGGFNLQIAYSTGYTAGTNN